MLRARPALAGIHGNERAALPRTGKSAVWIFRGTIRQGTIGRPPERARKRERVTAPIFYISSLRESRRTTMIKVEAIIQTSKLDAVKDALHEIGVEGMTVIEARGHGRQKGHTEFYRGREYTVDLIPKLKLEMVLSDEMAEKAVQAIITSARTGKIGDGKIFKSKVDDAIRIRNEERGDSAL
jgi:nitrogen regulatory protein P-II 1